MRGIRQFRVTQDHDYHVTVDVVADDAQEQITQDAVTKNVRPVVGDQVQLRVRLLDEIKVTSSGKHRYVVSHVKPGSQCPSESSTCE
jgi:hypothetical protein